MSHDRDDERFMRRALDLAERARGRTSPNPLVGAVLVHDGAVIAEAYHEAAGRPHAEVLALQAAGTAARGATLYVTLEPCAHHGRTPPCAPAVVAAGVRRVVAAVGDPDPRVAGRGFDILRAAGIDVTVGVLATEAARQNRVFFTAMREGRPHVTLKAAMTLDGKLADLRGTSRWITGEAARREAHRLRRDADAIVVGVSTVLLDDPRLTVRLDEPVSREPYRVVLDSHGRTPTAARVLTASTPARTIVFTTEGAPPTRLAGLRAAGATVVTCPARNGRVDIGAVLQELHAREVRSVLVEGGAEVHGSFVDAGLVDRVALFVAPILIGGRAATPVVGGGGLDLKSALRLGAVSVRAIGDDVLVEADVLRSE
jgi:diaminohydroxyphosphoribosylaminopyrimidine deaminase/5-amino-6-(5-phosphoribosylamino)uracil reductase